MMLRQTISDKQFLYLVLAILQSIVDYYTQFSFISSIVCQHWDVLVREDFKSKTGLPYDFPNEVLYHLLLYSLKMFKQVQTERKSVSVVIFANTSGILNQFFEHRFLDLQILG
ncbi:hypothetical protein G9A89_016245 [Geosiphon pyriformis]|nr:hypothetical protein G9A89_016245 [Geosiphon pyriformis]